MGRLAPWRPTAARAWSARACLQPTLLDQPSDRDCGIARLGCPSPTVVRRYLGIHQRASSDSMLARRREPSPRYFPANLELFRSASTHPPAGSDFVLYALRSSRGHGAHPVSQLRAFPLRAMQCAPNAPINAPTSPNSALNVPLTPAGVSSAVLSLVGVETVPTTYQPRRHLCRCPIRRCPRHLLHRRYHSIRLH